ECYENSEELIGKAVATRRREFYLFTKCGHGGGWARSDWRAKPLHKSIERSLQRLATDHLDLIQLHSCSLAELKKGDVIAALEQARERGLTRYIGYSGDGEAAHYAIECGRFDTLQTSVSIADQEALDLTLPLARKREMGVIAKRPIANVAWRYTRRPESYYADYWMRLRKLAYPFLHDDGAAVAPALRFTLNVPGVHPALVDVHGGAWSRGDRTVGPHHGRGLAACGLVVASLDFRQGPDHKHPAAAQDVSAGVRWVRANASTLGVDPARIGIAGHSSGGHLALLVATQPGLAEHAGTAIATADGSNGATAGDDSGAVGGRAHP